MRPLGGGFISSVSPTHKTMNPGWADEDPTADQREKSSETRSAKVSLRSTSR